MPVALARPIAWRQTHQIDAKVGKSTGVAEPLANAVSAGRVEGCRIAYAPSLRDRHDVDLGHRSTPCAMALGQAVSSRDRRPCFRIVDLNIVFGALRTGTFH